MTPTPFQKECIGIIDEINAKDFAGWFWRSSVMATIQIESAFRPHAYRYEPRLHEGSYGLMQTLASTARSLGLTAPPETLYTPEISIYYGMKCHRADWDSLTKRLGREPTLEEWTDAYNRGAGGKLLGSPDHAYVGLWMKARELWLPFDQAAH